MLLGRTSSSVEIANSPLRAINLATDAKPVLFQATRLTLRVRRMWTTTRLRICEAGHVWLIKAEADVYDLGVDWPRSEVIELYDEGSPNGSTVKSFHTL